MDTTELPPGVENEVKHDPVQKKRRAPKASQPVVRTITIALPISDFAEGANLACRLDVGRLPLRLRKAMKMLARGMCDSGAKVGGKHVTEQYRPAILKVLELVADEAGIER